MRRYPQLNFPSLVPAPLSAHALAPARGALRVWSLLLLLAALGGVAAGAHLMRTPASPGMPVPERPAAAAGAWRSIPAGVRERFARGVSLSFWFTNLES